MRHKVKRVGAVTGFWLLGLIVVLILLVPVALTLGVTTLNTGKADRFIGEKINAALAVSGIGVDFSSLTYDAASGFTIRDLSIKDEKGIAVTLDQLSLSVAFSKIPARVLDFSVDSGKLVLYRIPESRNETPPEPSKPFGPFETPNIFFNRILLRELAFDAIDIREGVFGTPLTLAPVVKADIGVTDIMTAILDVRPGATAQSLPAPLPDNLVLDGGFDPRSLTLALKKLTAASPVYSIEAHGNGSFLKSGALDYRVKAAYSDLSPLSGGAVASAKLDAALSGKTSNPALALDGFVETSSLKERGLDDIVLKSDVVQQDGIIKTHLTLGTSFKDRPVKLESLFHYLAPQITVESLTASAPSIVIDGKGVYNTETALADARFNFSASDLSTYQDLTGGTLRGNAKADISLKPLAEAQSVVANMSARDVVFGAVRISSLLLDAFVPDVSRPFPEEANIKASGIALAKDLSVERLSAAMTEDGNARYAVTIDGAGRYKKPLTVKGRASVGDIDAAFPSVQGIDLTAGLGRSSLRLTGNIDASAVDLRAAAADVRLTDLPVSLPSTVRGIRLSGNIAMTGTPQIPVTDATIAARGIDAGRYKGLSVDATAKHDGQQAQLSMKAAGPGIWTLSAAAGMPLAFSLSPFAFRMEDSAPLSGNFAADFDMLSISSLFLSANQSLSGRFTAGADISGTLAAPQIDGTANIGNGAFTDDQNGIVFQDIAADAVFSKDRVTLRSLSATDGESGRLTGRGDVSFGDSSRTTFSMTARNLHLPQSELADGHVSADLALKDVPDGYAASGRIDIADMNVTVPETFQTAIPELNIIDKSKSDAPVKTVSLDIDVNAPNRVFVRGWGLDAEFGGDIDITGDASAPEFNGAFSSRRGRYEEFGKRFTLERADLRFQGTIPPSPYLDIEATTPAEDVTASILLTGPVKAPEITFSSTPSLPEDEVLSRILFGRDTTTISPFQAVQLAQTLQRFSGKGGGFDPLAALRSATGLDDISVEQDDDGETNVGVGKYLTDDVYVEVERGKAEDSGAANIQIEVSPSVNIESRIGQDSEAGGGVFWKRDY